MADFMATTASNHPRVSDHEAVDKIISGYLIDPDLNVGVGFDEQTGEPYLFIYGYAWPEAWKVPYGVSHDEFDPYGDSQLYEDGADGFVRLLQEIAPYLIEPLTVQAIGSTECWFPLSACEWHIQPGGAQVDLNAFRNSDRQDAVTLSEAT